MSDFVKIETQEEFDKRIADRIQRERKSVEEKYADYETIKKEHDSFKTQIDDLNKLVSESKTKAEESAKTINELNSKCKAYETSSVKMRTALDVGLPYQMAERLSGETEEDIRKDAEALKEMMGSPKPVEPSADPYENVGSSDDKKAAMKDLLNNMKKTN